MSPSCRRIDTVFALLSLLVATCATALLSSSHLAAAQTASAPQSRVIIQAYAFHPSVLTVTRGTAVLWVNKDDDVHTIKSREGPASFKSPALDSGGRYEFTFRRAGIYHYICSVHPYMRGEIVVR
jgi:plastocyanin